MRCIRSDTSSVSFGGAGKDGSEDVHPRMDHPTTIHTVDASATGKLSESTMSLKKKGTCTLRSLPPTSSERATTTRTLTAVSDFGQMLVASFLMMPQSDSDFSGLAGEVDPPSGGIDGSGGGDKEGDGVGWGLRTSGELGGVDGVTAGGVAAPDFVVGSGDGDDVVSGEGAGEDVFVRDGQAWAGWTVSRGRGDVRSELARLSRDVEANRQAWIRMTRRTSE